MLEPRGKMTPFAFYVFICMKEAKKKYPDIEMSVEKFENVCLRRWRNMSDYHKKRFVQMSEYDKERYQKEMEIYRNFVMTEREKVIEQDHKEKDQRLQEMTDKEKAKKEADDIKIQEDGADSGDDWEDESESLGDDELDIEINEDYEIDYEFLVPDGYLSHEEEFKEDDEVIDPEKSKEKQEFAAKMFEKEHNKKTQELKPRLWGSYFTDRDELQDAASIQMEKILSSYAVIMVNNNNVVETSFSKKGKAKVEANQFSEEAIADLIRLIHGNKNNKMFLTREFIAFRSRTEGEAISQRKVLDKIQEVAEYRRPEEGGGMCWLVKSEILAVYGESNPMAWDYTLEQPNKNSKEKVLSVRLGKRKISGSDSSQIASKSRPGITSTPQEPRDCIIISSDESDDDD